MPRLRIVAVFAAAYILSYFFRSANAVIAADLTQDLKLSTAQLGFMTSVFLSPSPPRSYPSAKLWTVSGRAA